MILLWHCTTGSFATSDEELNANNDEPGSLKCGRELTLEQRTQLDAFLETFKDVFAEHLLHLYVYYLAGSVDVDTGDAMTISMISLLESC